MKLENQVVSLGLAKRLKELGFKQESLFCYKKGITKIFSCEFNDLDSYDEEFECSAYTVAELGEMLPDIRKLEYDYQVMMAYKNCNRRGKWTISIKGMEENFDTEANARAKMLIYLKENNLI